MNPLTIKRALISVSDKTGIVDFARKLQSWNIEILSTGGTLKTLLDAGIRARSVSDMTGFPEILDGRVKTLHPKIHAGLLAVLDNPAHRQQLAEHDITPIDLIVVNLYPFEQTVAKHDVGINDAVEQIDVGGPSMLRAAAKNFRFTVVVIHPIQYENVAREMERTSGAISEGTRLELARQAFLRTATYDMAIGNYLSSSQRAADASPLSDMLSLQFPKAEELRYGENPHQRAALYGDFGRFFAKLHGKELSYNNIVDIQAAAELVEEFDEPTVAIVKHTNPCGTGSASTLADAYTKALATDPKSAFGGIVAANRPLDTMTAQLLDKTFTEVIVAPEYPGDVLDFLKKKKERRVMQQLKPLSSEIHVIMKHVAGGVIVQTPDTETLAMENIKVVTKRTPTADERAGMEYAWRVAKHEIGRASCRE